MVTDNDTTLISALTDNTVNIVYKSATWGKMTVNGATVTESNNLYTISGSGTVLMGMSGSTPKNYDCTFTGTVEAGHARSEICNDHPFRDGRTYHHVFQYNDHNEMTDMKYTGS